MSERKMENEKYEYDVELDYKIVNLVATVSVEITERIDLTQIARKYGGVEYNPERFPGLIMRIDKPRATILIFSTGKMVLTGIREVSDAERAACKVVKDIRRAGIKVSNPEIYIRNLVATGVLRLKMDLNAAVLVMEHVMYEPEVFPGLIYRMQDPKCVFLLFSTGKFVCVGLKSEVLVKEAVSKLNRQIRELGVEKKDIDVIN